MPAQAFTRRRLALAVASLFAVAGLVTGGIAVS